MPKEETKKAKKSGAYDLSGFTGLVRTNLDQTDVTNREFTRIRTRWVTDKDPDELVSTPDKRVFIASPDIDVPPYTVSLPMPKRLELIEQGRKAAEQFVKFCYKR